MTSHINGLLIIDKPVGPSSHDVVARIRRKLGTRKVGHAGTLDPDASGVLVVCVGEATRLLEYLTTDEKTYDGDIVFGQATDTDDGTGSVIQEMDASFLSESMVQTVISKFLGDIPQQVPRFSAVHIEGHRAYDLARSGVDFEPPTRIIHIRNLTLSGFHTEGTFSKARFTVRCSKGTYIRSLCRDIGISVGVPAHMASLRRTASGLLSIDQAVSLSDFEACPDASQFLQNPLGGLKHMQVLELALPSLMKLSFGQNFEAPSGYGEGIYLGVFEQQIASVVECVKVDDRYLIKPKKVFWQRGD